MSPMRVNDAHHCVHRAAPDGGDPEDSPALRAVGTGEGARTTGHAPGRGSLKPWDRGCGAHDVGRENATGGLDYGVVLCRSLEWSLAAGSQRLSAKILPCWASTVPGGEKLHSYLRYSSGSSQEE